MLTKDQRMQSWNVRFMCGTDAVAGIYQRDDLLCVADVAHELELCLVLRPPAAPDSETWQPALLDGQQQLLVLDKKDTTPFPTPSPRATMPYELVFHQHSVCAAHKGTHSWRGMYMSTICTPPHQAWFSLREAKGRLLLLL